MEPVCSFADRLSEIMKRYHYTYALLSKDLDIPAQTLNRYVLNQRQPKAKVVLEIAQKLDVNPLWLSGYEVPEQSTQEIRLVTDTSDSVPSGGIQTSPETGYITYCMPDDSMLNAGIRAGDRLIAAPTDALTNESLLLYSPKPGTYLVRRLHLQGPFVLLQAENAGAQTYIYPVEEFKGNIRAVGIIQKLIREF